MYKRALAIITGLAGIAAFHGAVTVLYLGIPLTWVFFLWLATGAAALVAAFFIWTGHRLRIATGVVAWVLISVWIAPLAVWQAHKFWS
jgi:hypothetical protein